MEAKRQVRGQAEGSDVWLHQQQAALDWLAAQGREAVLHCWIPRLMPIDNSNSGGKIPGN